MTGAILQDLARAAVLTHAAECLSRDVRSPAWGGAWSLLRDVRGAAPGIDTDLSGHRHRLGGDLGASLSLEGPPGSKISKNLGYPRRRPGPFMGFEQRTRNSLKPALWRGAAT